MHNDYFIMAALRSLVAEEGHHWDLYTWSDQRVLEFVAGELELGRLRISERARTVFSGGKPREPAEAETEEKLWPPAEVEPEVETKTWIEVELVGEDGQPVPGERYAIKKQDGTPVASGRLDKVGYAYKGHLESGTYLVSFPNLDEEAWERA